LQRRGLAPVASASQSRGSVPSAARRPRGQAGPMCLRRLLRLHAQMHGSPSKKGAKRLAPPSACRDMGARSHVPASRSHAVARPGEESLVTRTTFEQLTSSSSCFRVRKDEDGESETTPRLSPTHAANPLEWRTLLRAHSYLTLFRLKSLSRCSFPLPSAHTSLAVQRLSVTVPIGRPSPMVTSVAEFTRGPSCTHDRDRVQSRARSSPPSDGERPCPIPW
jgi:hypothetical protein